MFASRPLWMTCFQRVYDAVGRMAERLSTYEPSSAEDNAKNTFRDSLVYNVVELADLLPSLNITDDQRLTDLAKRLKADLAEHFAGRTS